MSSDSVTAERRLPWGVSSGSCVASSAATGTRPGSGSRHVVARAPRPPPRPARRRPRPGSRRRRRGPDSARSPSSAGASTWVARTTGSTSGGPWPSGSCAAAAPVRRTPAGRPVTTAANSLVDCFTRRVVVVRLSLRGAHDAGHRGAGEQQDAAHHQEQEEDVGAELLEQRVRDPVQRSRRPGRRGGGSRRRGSSRARAACPGPSRTSRAARPSMSPARRHSGARP